MLFQVFTGKPVFAGNGNHQISTILNLFRVLGSPTGDCLTALSPLPHWSHLWPKFKVNLPETWQNALGDRGVVLLLRMLKFGWIGRTTADDVCVDPYWTEEVFLSLSRAEPTGQVVVDTFTHTSGSVF
jgi:hypothetical protein